MTRMGRLGRAWGVVVAGICLAGTLEAVTPGWLVADGRAGVLAEPGLSVSGQVLATDGSPRPAADVRLAVLVTDAGTGAQRSITAETTQTDGTGRYALAVSGSRLAEVYGQPGPIPLEVQAGGSELHVYDLVVDVAESAGVAKVAVEGSGTPTDTVSVTFQDGLGAVPEVGGPAISADPVSGIAPGSAAEVDIAEDYVETGYPAPPAPAGTGPETDPSDLRSANCDSIIWWPTDRWKRGWLPVSTLKTEYKSRQSYVWHTTTETRIGVAITGAYGEYAGGLTASTVNESGAMVEMVVAAEHTTRTLKVQWSFRRNHAICVHAPDYPGDPTAGQHYIRKFKWIPHHWTTGNIKPEGYVGWACNVDYEVPVQNKTTVMRRSTTTWDGWVSVAGVAIDNSQTGSERTKTVIEPRAGQRATICGYGDEPLRAEAIKERV